MEADSLTGGFASFAWPVPGGCDRGRAYISSERGGRVVSRAFLRFSAGFVVAALVVVSVSLYLSTRYMGEQERLSGTGDLEGAMQSAEMAGRLDPFSAGPLEAKAYLWQRQGRSGESDKALVAAAEREPGNYSIPQQLGTSRMEVLNQPSKAAESYERSLDLNPRSTTTLSGLATAYLSAGELEKAKTAYERLQGLERLDVNSLYDLGRIYVRTGEPAKGVEALREAERRSSSELKNLNGGQREQQTAFIQSVELAIADGLVVERRYVEARQIVAASDADQAATILSLIDSDPEGYRQTVRGSDVY